MRGQNNDVGCFIYHGGIGSAGARAGVSRASCKGLHNHHERLELERMRFPSQGRRALGNLTAKMTEGSGARSTEHDRTCN